MSEVVADIVRINAYNAVFGTERRCAALREYNRRDSATTPPRLPFDRAVLILIRLFASSLSERNALSLSFYIKPRDAESVFYAGAICQSVS